MRQPAPHGETRGQPCSYVLITPARNEAQYIGRTIKCVIGQTLRPLRWIIVSDGSTDGTDLVVKTLSAGHNWIRLVTVPPRRERHFAGKVQAFNAGYAEVKDLDYGVIGNLDGDVSFDDPEYFEFLMHRFAENPKLGVCGTAYLEGGGLYPNRFTSIEDVFGACQMFRRECFEQIGGYHAIRSGGIDLVAFLSARAKGWQTWTFTEKICTHHRAVGSGQDNELFRRLLNAGRKDYLLGCHPAWELLRCTYQMKNRPYILSGLLQLAGYFGAALGRVERTLPGDLVALRRADQMRRLRGFLQSALRRRLRPQPAITTAPSSRLTP